jgi:hypothetical protein
MPWKPDLSHLDFASTGCRQAHILINGRLEVW